MTSIESLRSYYEEEARRAVRTAPKGFRTAWKDDFVALLVAEQRRSVIDFGAGPGFDAQPFDAAGLRFVGLDLAVGNALIARGMGIEVVPGAMAAPPFRRASFDAGWSMSVLMHVPEDQVSPTVAAMVDVLVPAAPLFIGLWGGDRRDEIDDARIEGQRRLFSLRPVEQNLELLADHGEVVSARVIDAGSNGWEYQGFLIRTGS